jgi:hypothetical protein
MLDAFAEPRIYQRGEQIHSVSSNFHSTDAYMLRGKEYNVCHDICKECVKHHEFTYEPMNPDSFREIADLYALH